MYRIVEESNQRKNKFLHTPTTASTTTIPTNSKNSHRRGSVGAHSTTTTTTRAPHDCFSSHLHNSFPPPLSTTSSSVDSNYHHRTTLPYDEVQMDKVQTQRLRMRADLIEGGNGKLRNYSASSSSSSSSYPYALELQAHSTASTNHSNIINKNNNKIRRDSLDKYSMPLTPTTHPEEFSQQQQHTTPQQPITHTTTSTSTSTCTSTGGGRRKSNKARPWQTDVKLNRFSNGGGSSHVPVVASSSTQKSTMGWKQRMQERRAVFGNVAVLEQTHEEQDDDGWSATSGCSKDIDNDNDNDDGSSSRCSSSRGRNRSSMMSRQSSSSRLLLAKNKNNNANESSILEEEEEYDDDDYRYGDDDDDDDEESRGDRDQEAIHNEAVALLKSKGFQGILQQQYNDDLESVGPSCSVTKKSGASLSKQLSNSTSTSSDSGGSKDGGGDSGSSNNINISSSYSKYRQVLRLDEIQSLRRKILLQQMDRTDSTLPCSPKEFEKEPFDEQKTINNNHPLVPEQDDPTTTVATTGGGAPLPDDDSDAAKAWRVMKELKVRLKDVFTEDHVILEAMGRKGLYSPSQTKVVIDTQAFARHKLRDAVEKRVSLVFTGDHLVVCNGEVQPREIDLLEEEIKQKAAASAILQEEFLPGDTPIPNGSPDDSLTVSEDTATQQEEKDAESLPPIKSPELRERLSDSFTAFEAIVKARQQESMAGDDEWTECSTTVVEPTTTATTLRNTTGMIPSLPQGNANNHENDDQSCWTEYTIETNGIQTEQRQSSDNGSSSSSLVKEQSGCQEECNTKAAALTSNSDDGDDYTYAEFTVQDGEPPAATAAPSTINPFRLPGQAQLVVPVQARRQQQQQDDQSYMEFTVRDDDEDGDDDDDDDEDCAPQAKRDDQSYMEFTVQDTVEEDSPPTRLPRQQLRKPTPSDDQSYMEFTIRDDQDDQRRQNPTNDLTSPHLQSMLSSRMFADMDLPESLRQQQPPQRNLEEEDHGNYPTITIAHDDDDMTQITFDHTMDEGTITPHDHHQHAVQYFNSTNGKQRHSMTTYAPNINAPTNYYAAVAEADFPSVVGSQHTEQTRDTTVSDDGSSHHDESFRSCASSESSQLVAELLRRDIWSPDPAVVQGALEKLVDEASKGFHQRSNIVRYGGLLAILRAMELKQDKAPIQAAACVALAKMAVDDTTKAAIGEVGCIPAIANAMQNHTDDIDVQRTACKALAILTRQSDGCEDQSRVSADDPVPTGGVVQAVTNSMKLYPEHSEIQENSFGTLANLCLDNKNRLRDLKNLGGLAAMTTALQVPWENKTDQHEAISTLSILLRSLADLDQ